MSRRNPMNERYTVDDKVQGRTRKSASSAKPVAKAASNLLDPLQKSKKQKKAEQKEREAKINERRGTTGANDVYDIGTDEYKRLRKLWWVLLAAAVVCTLVSWTMGTNPALTSYSIFPLVLAYGLIIAAFYVDLGPIRRLRKQFNASRGGAGKSKVARAAQKQHAAELREKKKAEAEAAANGENKKKPGLFARIFKRKTAEDSAKK